MEENNTKEYRLQVDEEIGILILLVLPEEAKIIRSLKFFYSIKPDAHQFHMVNKNKPYFKKVMESSGRTYYRYCEVYIGQVDRMVENDLDNDLLYYIPDATYSILMSKDSVWSKTIKGMYTLNVIEL